VWPASHSCRLIKENSRTHWTGLWVAGPGDRLNNFGCKNNRAFNGNQTPIYHIRRKFSSRQWAEKFCHPVTRVPSYRSKGINSITQSVLFITTCKIRDSAHKKKGKKRKKESKLSCHVMWHCHNGDRWASGCVMVVYFLSSLGHSPSILLFSLAPQQLTMEVLLT
jgi:hypothetical protein